MTTTPISRKALGDLVEARLKTLTGVTVYRGEVPGKPPVKMTGGQPDSSGRVAPYVVLYAGAGRRSDEVDVAAIADDLDWPFQTTCVAGFEQDCERLIDRVDGVLNRWSPAIAGLGVGRVRPPVGFEAGLIRPDEQVSPIRFYLPLQWRLAVTT